MAATTLSPRRSENARSGLPARTAARCRSTDARAADFVSRRVGQRRFGRVAQERRPALHLRGHDVGGHEAEEQDTGENEEHQEEDDGHDRDEEVRHQQLGPDAPEQAPHEVAAQAHESPGEVDEQDAAGEDVQAAGKGRARTLGRVEGERGDQDAAGPALQEEVLPSARRSGDPDFRTMEGGSGGSTWSRLVGGGARGL